MPFECTNYASTIVHCDHVHVIQGSDHCISNLTNLLEQFDMKLKKSHLLWIQERIIWIGFEKNETNQKMCIFGRKEFSKDVVNHILSFLR